MKVLWPAALVALTKASESDGHSLLQAMSGLRGHELQTDFAEQIGTLSSHMDEQVMQNWVDAFSRKWETLLEQKPTQYEALLQRASQGSEVAELIRKYDSLSTDAQERLVTAAAASPKLSQLFADLPLAHQEGLLMQLHEFDQVTSDKKKSSSPERSTRGKDKKKAKAALLVIDVQDCFLDKGTTSGKPGSLAVPASQIIEIVNQVREEKSCWFDEVIFSQDFHPSNHISFGSTHGLAPFSHLGGKGSLPLRCVKAGKDRAAACCPTFHVSPSDVDCTKQLCPPQGWNYTVDNPGIINGNQACTFCKENPTDCFDTHQSMWTDHCLATGDSTFPPKLNKKGNDVVIKKGTNQFVDAYSAFFDNTRNYQTELAKTLKSKGIETIFVVGIATDVCVYETVRDAIEQVSSIKNVYVIQDATAAVSGNKVNFDAAIDGMQFLGATVLSSKQVLEASCKQNVHEPPPPKPATCGGKSALMVIDVQDCFLEKETTSGKAGSLSVPASHLIPLINKMRKEKSCLFDHVIFSQDYHPANHISFGSTHGLAPFSHLGGKGALPMMCIKPSSDPWLQSSAGESLAACCPSAYVAPQNVDCTKQLCPPEGWNYTVNNSGIIDGNKACTLCKEKPELCYETHQSMWTDHCLATGDSTFPPTLKKEAGDVTVRKGENQFADAYSAFMDNSHTVKTELEAKLAELCVDTLYVVGIATDVCVKETVMDAFSHIPGVKKVTVIKDATAAVQGNQVNFDNSIDEMQSEGATIMTVAELLKQDCPTSVSAKLQSQL